MAVKLIEFITNEQSSAYDGLKRATQAAMMRSRNYAAIQPLDLGNTKPTALIVIAMHILGWFDKELIHNKLPSDVRWNI